MTIIEMTEEDPEAEAHEEGKNNNDKQY